MSGHIKVFSICCLILLLASCQVKKPSAKSAVTGNNNNTIVITAPKPQADESIYPYHPSETVQNDLLHTGLKVSFDWKKQHMNGIATVRAKPYFYPQDSLILDAKGMDIHSVTLLTSNSSLSPGSHQPTKYNYDGKKLRIYLGKTYTRRDSFEVEVNYTAKPNELPKGGSQAITSDIGLYFINPLGKEPDKPRQIWTQGETEAASCWFPTIDAPNQRCTQEMFITVDTGFAVLSNGKFLGEVLNKDGTKTWHWKQDLPHAPYLFMMAIGKYAIVKDKWRGMEVNYYVEPKFEKYAMDIFGHTPEMIEFFSEKLKYKYPWTKYSQVVVRDYVSGAMENTTATIFMEGLQMDDRALADDNWDYIIAHELFHHWFGDLVTCESWSNLPLNESFANYSEYLWAEHKFGPNEAEYHGENETEEYFDEAKRKKVPLIRFHYKDREDMFDRHSYNKGGRVLHMLRKYVGDEAFFDALNLYLERNRFTAVEIHDLRLAFEDVTGEDLNWFFNQWFMASGYPELKISHEYSNGVLTVNVLQEQDTTNTPVYKLPVKLDVWVNGTKTTYPVTVKNREEKFTFELPAAPQLVVFDSEKQLLGQVSHEKSVDEWVYQFMHYDGYLVRKQAMEELFKPQIKLSAKNEGDKAVPQISNPFDDQKVKEVLALALEDKFWAIRSLALDQFSIYPILPQDNYVNKVEQIAKSDPKTSVRARAIYLLSSYSNKAYVDLYKRAMSEKSYMVSGAGLAGYLKSGDSTVKINFAEWEKLDNVYIILPLASYYESSGTKGKYEWFKQKLTKGSPKVIYNLMESFVNYVLKVEKEKREDATAILKDISVNNRYEQIRNLAKLYLGEMGEKARE